MTAKPKSGRSPTERFTVMVGFGRARRMLPFPILCSQFASSTWHAKLGNDAIANAVIDRVVYKSYTMHIEGDESMRKRMGESLAKDDGILVISLEEFLLDRDSLNL